jgi:hypothetical protein
MPYSVTSVDISTKLADPKTRPAVIKKMTDVYKAKRTIKLTSIELGVSERTLLRWCSLYDDLAKAMQKAVGREFHGKPAPLSAPAGGAAHKLACGHVCPVCSATATKKKKAA